MRAHLLAAALMLAYTSEPVRIPYDAPYPGLESRIGRARVNLERWAKCSEPLRFAVYREDDTVFVTATCAGERLSAPEEPLPDFSPPPLDDYTPEMGGTDR